MIKMFFYLIISCISSYAVYVSSYNNNTITKDAVEVKVQETEQHVMEIKIPNINLNGIIYEKESKQNNIDKNIVIMNDSSYPNEKGGIVIIGAHSGTGPLAYFKNLNMLKINDKVEIIYENKKYDYYVTNIYLDSKDGSIIVNNYNSTSKLYLYTCNPKDKNNYLVVVCEQRV